MELLRRIEAHLRRSGTTATAFGRAALGDPGLVHQMRRGRTPRQRTRARLDAYLDAAGAAE